MASLQIQCDSQKKVPTPFWDGMDLQPLQVGYTPNTVHSSNTKMKVMVIIVAYVDKYLLSSLSTAYTMLKKPVLIPSLKLSNIGPG